MIPPKSWEWRVARDTLAMGAGDVIARGLLLMVGVLVSRELGPVSFGQFTYSMSVLGYGVLLVDAGLTTYLIRRHVLEPERRHELVVDATFAQLLLAMATGFLIAVAAILGWFPSGSNRLILAGLPLLAAQAVNLSYILQSQLRIRAVAVAKMTRGVATFAFCAIFLFKTSDLSLVLVGVWLGQTVSSLIAYGALRRGDKAIRWTRPKSGRSAALLRGGAPFLALALAVQFIVAAPLIALPAFSDGEGVGFYAAATTVTQHIVLAAGIAATAAFPRLVHSSATDRSAFASQVSSLMGVAAAISIPLTACAMFQARPIMVGLFGTAFEGATVTFGILASVLALSWVNTVAAFALNSASHERDYLVTLGVASAIGTLAFAILAPQFGNNGAATSVVLAELIITIGLGRAAARRLSIHLTEIASRLPMETLLCVAILGVTRTVLGDTRTALAFSSILVAGSVAVTIRKTVGSTVSSRT